MKRLFSRAASLLRNLTRKDRRERDLTDEIRSYVQMLAEDKMKAGMSETDAFRAAMLETEGIEQVKEQVRQVRCGYRLEMFVRDLQFAIRTLRKAPAFSIAVALVLA